MCSIIRRFLFTAIIAGATATSGAEAQDSAREVQQQGFSADRCGAGGMGCTPADVRPWLAKGNELANLASADLSQYAYACAAHPEWKQDCESDPGKILRRLGITDF